MESLLEYNPYFRPSAKEVLKNKIFDEVRIKENEKDTSGKAINIAIDKAGSEWVFDYEAETYSKTEE